MHSLATRQLVTQTAAQTIIYRPLNVICVHVQQQPQLLPVLSVPGSCAVRQQCRVACSPSEPAAAAATTAPHPEPLQASVADATPAAAVDLPASQPQDILKATTADGSELFLEVVSVSSHNSSSGAAEQQQQLTVAHEGVLYQLVPNPAATNSSSSSSSSSSSAPSMDPAATSTPWLLQPQSWLLQPESDLVKALPGWSAAVHQQQARQQLPAQPVAVQSVSKVYSAAVLQAEVQQNPAAWRDGTGPSDPPPKGLQYRTLCAGEIEALLCGQRGVVMVQLWVGWDAGVPQPVANPLVLHSLRRALCRKDISIFMATAPGGLGLTAILAAQVEPFRSWGAHLASFGAQAALVADSPYYKLLIGRILGYAEPNIRHHILATTGKPVSAEVSAAVDKDLRGLSKQKPKLPWKAVAAASSSSVGQQQQQQQRPAGQQQLSRSARKKQKK